MIIFTSNVVQILALLRRFISDSEEKYCPEDVQTDQHD